MTYTAVCEIDDWTLFSEKESKNRDLIAQQLMDGQWGLQAHGLKP